MTITVTFTAPDSLIATYMSNSPQFPLMHLMALGQALVVDADPHEHRYRGDTPSAGPVIVAEFPDVGKAGLTWWWHGLAHPREQIRAFGAYLLNEANIQFWFAQLAQRQQQAGKQEDAQKVVLWKPGMGQLFHGQNNPMRQ